MSVRPVAFYVWLVVLVLFAALPLTVVQAQTPPATPPLPDALALNDLLPASSNLELLGQTGGYIGDIMVQGDRAYMTVGASLHILDLTDPAHPSLMGYSPVLSPYIRDVDVVDDYAYVTAGEDGLYILDVSNPVEPVVVGFSSGQADDVTVSEAHAYIKNLTANQLQILDVSNPANPTEVSTYTTDGRLVGVAVIGQHAYLAVNNGYDSPDGVSTDDLYILDVSDPSHPVNRGFYNSYNGVTGLFVYGQHLYLLEEGIDADYNAYYGFRVLDVTQPTRPVWIAGYYARHHLLPHVHGDYLYVSSGNLLIYEASNPAARKLIGVSEHTSSVIAFVGNYAYLVDGSRGLRILDVSFPTNLTWVGQYYMEGSPLDVAVAGSYAYVASGGAGLQVVDVSNPVTPTYVSQHETPGTAWSVAVVNDLAYVADGVGGLRILDISNPAAPQELGSHPGMGKAQAVDVVGEFAYVADSEEGLLVFDVTDSSAPVLTGSHPGAARDVTVVPPYAYVAVPGGLRVLNIAHPARPVWVGFYAAPDDVFAIAVAGDYAYVAASAAGLRIVDISDPAAPTEVGFHETPKYATDVAVSGENAYVTIGEPYVYYYATSGELQIFNVSNRTSPQYVESYYGLWDARGVTVAGPYAYVVDGRYELRVLDIANPPSLRRVTRYAMPGNVINFAITTDNAYIVGDGGLYITDVSSPTNPLPYRYYPLPGLADMVVAENYAYLIGDNLRVLDVSNPDLPVEVASHPQGGAKIALADEYLYIGDDETLRIFNVSNPLVPVEVFSEVVPYGTIIDIAVAEGKAYVLVGESLTVYDVTNPATSTKVDSFYSGNSKSVAVSGPYAYIAYDYFSDNSRQRSGLLILDTSQPPNTSQVGRYDLPEGGGGADVAVADGIAYLTTISGVHVLDVSQPTGPALMARYPLQPSGRRIALADGHIYVGTRSGGLYIFRYAGGDALRVHLPLLYRRAGQSTR